MAGPAVPRRRTLGWMAVACAAMFLLLWYPQEQRWVDPVNDAVDAVLGDGLESRETTSVDCRATEAPVARNTSQGWTTYTTVECTPPHQTPYLVRSSRAGSWNGTWTENVTRVESIVPWAGIPLMLGDEAAAVAIGLAVPTTFLLLRAKRTAAIGALAIIVGGLLVSPLKYGGSWAPYPSGHTIGATLGWGTLLLLGSLLLARRGDLTPRGVRWALAAWGFIALMVGIDLIHMGYHPISDIVLGWAFAGCVVFAAAWLDSRLSERTANTPRQEAKGSPEAPA